MNPRENRATREVLLYLLGLFLLAGLGAVPGAWAKRFVVEDAYGRNLVQFTSRATLETIVGITNQVGGYIEVDPDDILNSPDCYIEVDLRSLRTGIEPRDRKMREELLEVDSFPKATFRLERILKTGSRRLVDQRRFELTVEGVFSLHGVEKPLRLAVDLTYFKESQLTRARQPGDLLHLRATFEIRLSEFGIRIPRAVLAKLDDRQNIMLDVFASASPGD